MNIRLTVNVIGVSVLRIPHIPEYALYLSPLTIINLGKECTFLPFHTVNKIVPPWVPQTLCSTTSFTFFSSTPFPTRLLKEISP